MKTVTYTDLENAAPVIEVMGVTFVSGEPQEVEDAVAAHVKGNPFFAGAAVDETVTEPDAARMENVRGRGAQAKLDGKDRNVPPAYRGKPEEAAWLTGYDETVV